LKSTFLLDMFPPRLRSWEVVLFLSSFMHSLFIIPQRILASSLLKLNLLL
jgi:hypothetical protein